MKQGISLEAGETIVWEGKPAPRCYTFRHWRHSVFGALFLAICSYWQILGIHMAAEYETSWLAWLPIPFVLIGLYFSVGHLLQARLEWNNVSYAITNKRLIAVRGTSKANEQSVALSDVTYFNLKMLGEELGTFKIYAGETNQFILHCLEHPLEPAKLLELAIKDNTEKPEDQRDDIS